MKFFVGCYTRLGGPGVGLCELDGDSLRLIEASSEVKNPTYVILSPDRKTLYATADDEYGEVAAFDVSEGRLTLVSRQETAGRSACHMTLSPDERFLYVANYMTGSVAVFPVNGAQISPRIQLIEHEGHGPNPDRQEKAHCHFVSFDPEDSELLYVVDLGIDAVMIYRQNPETGLLTVQERADAPQGMGPRHLVFSGRSMMYVAHELGSAVSAYRRAGSGWQLLQTLSTLPEDYDGENTVAAIRLCGKLLLVSNRGHDSLAAYRIGLDGMLSPVGIYSTMGRTPRDFFPLGDGRMLVAHQDSGDISLLELELEETEIIHDVTRTRRILMNQLAENGLCLISDPLPYPGAVCVCPSI